LVGQLLRLAVFRPPPPKKEEKLGFANNNRSSSAAPPPIGNVNTMEHRTAAKLIK
jgi:hypothetical protein